ncbi:TIGR04076 family protein [Thermococcus celer]|uniref:TIGR04076 family protein n=1 Tax=Thermococcus celer Vu 13 = JCM 8558 TaxID=1293037 RepID=A0A218P357_THECE|nr:TIGR04076 family protein [Thermococcus celer]ASI99363.1 TIGR04076 family protein [Thermococcus celer Vu 13 = JCM 8558]
MERLEITVKEIRGKCPVYKLGDRIVIEGPEVKLDETDAICTHAFASLLPYIVALRKGIKPRELGLGRGEKAYLQCLDPGEPYTDGGTVIFEVTVVRDEAEKGVENSEGDR